jgi:two-component system, NarL family, invasion response regulator UvrY
MAVSTINKNNIKVALVDDHILIRSSLSKLVASYPNCSVLFEADNGRHCIDFLEKHLLPDVLLLDISMPVMDGFETAVYVSKHFPLVRILTLTMLTDERSIVKMFKNGARGYLSKNVSPQELHLAINTMAEKNMYMPEEISSKLVTGLQHDLSEVVPVSALTDKEKEFLALVPTDFNYVEIAKKMSVSPRTVDDYREKLFKKLQVNSRMGLAIYAIRNDLF